MRNTVSKLLRALNSMELSIIGVLMISVLLMGQGLYKTRQQNKRHTK